MKKKPLVSIMIPNYNHSKYLDMCVNSAINQTYENTEIVILDNSSEDDSVQIASKYATNNIRICRNAYNILNRSYYVLDQLTTGKYKMMLCADDFIEPDFLECAVDIMEKYPSVGYVHGERDFITDSGEIIKLEPFYNCSFFAPGRDTMPVYMVTTVAHPSQGIFREEAFRRCRGYHIEIDHMNADRMLWYNLSYQSDYAYIRKKMSNIRVGNQTETFVTQTNFQHPILCHLTLKEMVRFAKKHELEAVYRREEEALERLARDFINYAAGMLAVNDRVCAGRYLNYIKVICYDMTKQEVYQRLLSMQQGKDAIDIEYLKTITFNVIQKPRNYEPPLNYQQIDLEVL